MHKLQFTQTRKKDREGNPIPKQKLVDDYNLHMGGVDKNDAINGNYSSVRKSHKRSPIKGQPKWPFTFWRRQSLMLLFYTENVEMVFVLVILSYQ